jgi:hypothetical protein
MTINNSGLSPWAVAMTIVAYATAEIAGRAALAVVSTVVVRRSETVGV